MKYLIVSGGHTDYAFAQKLVKNSGFEVIIGVDAGMEFLYDSKIMPDVVIGDFDSVNESVLDYYVNQEHIEICSLNPEKDMTDTESAIQYAIAHEADEITILGATGNRLDHVFGNVALLGMGLEHKVYMEIVDANNRIRMFDQPVTIRRKEMFGQFLSLIPYTDVVKNVTLKGLKYPLENYDMGGFHSLGISNELAADTAEISFTDGILLVIESRD